VCAQQHKAGAPVRVPSAANDLSLSRVSSGAVGASAASVAALRKQEKEAAAAAAHEEERRRQSLQNQERAEQMMKEVFVFFESACGGMAHM
jgi:hypothetical protein